MKSKLVKLACFAAGVALAFMAGRHSVGDDLFWTGYDAAMGHVRSTIEAKTPELEPFYIADLGIKFIPRSVNIVGIKIIDGSGKMEDRFPGKQKHLTLNVEHRTLNGSSEGLR